jgi:cytochrome c553
VVAYAFSLSMGDSDQARATEIYAGECAACHGGDGKQAAGSGPQTANAVPALNDQERMASKTAADLFDVITKGASQMPAYGDTLSEAERWALSDYVRLMTFANTAGPQTAAQPGVQDTPLVPSSTQAAGVEATESVTATQAVSSTLPLGVVSGAVTTAAGDPAPGGLTVNLHAFQGMNLAYTSTTTLKQDGTYVFEDLDMPEGMAYLSTVEFGGVLYGSDVIMAKDPAKPLELPIQIFETTTDTSVLTVDRLHYFFEPVDEDTLRVLELYIISNPSDKTVMAEKRGDPVLTFTLPQGAENLQFEDGALGDRYKETPGGFGDTIPVRPGVGAYQVLFSYEMPFNRKLELTRTTPLITQAVVILAPEDTLTVKGDNLEDAGARDMQGVQYHMYNAPAMGPGGDLTLTVNARSRGLRLASAPSSNLIIGLSALGLTLLVAGAWLFNRTRRSDDQDEADDELDALPSANLDSREAVMDAILALDDLYQEGKLPEDAYMQRRAELKARLQILKD